MTGGACSNFTVLATICYEMGGMADCAGYNGLCRNGSVVPQCRNEPDVRG